MFAWGLYDFANTIFSMNVVSLYFAVWVVNDLGASPFLYSLALSGSMLSMAIISPPLGALSDRYGRRKPFLMWFTVICCAATAGLTFSPTILWALLVFAVANFAYQSGLIYYDSLLASVSSEATRGRISGMGVALGYVGAIGGILLVKPFVDAGGRQAAFLPTGLLFLLFALPCFLLVPEGARGAEVGLGRLVRESFAQVAETLRRARSYAGLWRFILARFLYVDAINTVIAMMSLYAVNAVGFGDQELQQLVVLSTTAAVAGSFALGFVVERFGPKRTLTAILVMWALVLVMAALIREGAIFYLIGAIVGICLGGTWTSDRVYLLRLSPPEAVGEFFGLYGLAGRFASVIGPLLWGLALEAFSPFGADNYRWAMVTLLLPLLLGFGILRGVPEGRRARHPEEP